MLCYLIHISTATFDNIHETLLDIDMQAHENNPKHGITGLLLYDSGLFFQILEGEEKEVETLFDNVKRDPRNKDVILISKSKLEKRNFSEWTMKLKDISRISHINWLASIKELNPQDFNSQTSLYITIISNLLMGALNEEYKEIQAALSQHIEPNNEHLETFRSLSIREKEVLQLLVKGNTAKKIGKLLNISDKTAARHTENMCKKLKSSNKSDLIIKVFSSGYLNEILAFKS